jgi:predicted NUDIX family NTP pyrophosphohydrolase
VTRSAGLLLFRRGAGGPEVLIAHMGGPFWARRDAGAWSIPKGEYGVGEEPLAVALREFAEEMGSPAPPGTTLALGEFRQAGGKRVTVFAREGDLDPATVRSNEFEIEWPPRSGRRARFPEVDRAEWASLARAREALVRGQAPAVDALAALLGDGAPRSGDGRPEAAAG